MCKAPVCIIRVLLAHVSSLGLVLACDGQDKCIGHKSLLQGRIHLRTSIQVGSL